MSGDLAPIRFTDDDLKLFSAASGDRNPLHTSASYSRGTVYGQQVVFGALGALACLGRIEVPTGQKVIRLTADFHRPMSIGVEYRIKSILGAESESVRLLDGTVPVLTLSVTRASARDAAPSRAAPAELFERLEPAEWDLGDIDPGLRVSGHYRANASLVQELRRRWNITAEPLVAETLLWASYFVGMELPGRTALFFSLALDFEEPFATPAALVFDAVVLKIKTALAQIRIAVSLDSDGRRVASGHLISFIRPRVETLDLLRVQASDALAGKVALVAGASRGLGAAITGVLAMQGAHVIAMARSASAEFLKTLPPEIADRVTPEEGDAEDRMSLERLRAHIAQKHSRLDILICNAFPAIPALRLELNAFARISEYLNHAANLVLGPLCAFLDLLNESGGCAVIISSTAVDKPVREWPHYVAAKSAVEAFAAVAPLQYPRTSTLIVRPERLLTEMTNTPMGRRNALPPSQMARQIVEKLLNPPPAGTVEIYRGKS